MSLSSPRLDAQPEAQPGAGVGPSPEQPAELPPQREVDVETLRGLAHPLRMKILEELAIHGPATATLLAARLGESSGSTSYHLRMLSRHGLVEDDPDQGPGGRERWWRRAPGGLNMRGFAHRNHPAAREAAGVVLDELDRGRTERRERWWTFTEENPAEAAPWVDATSDSDYILTLTQEEAAELTSDLAALIGRWRRRVAERTQSTHPDAVPVEAQIFTFPHLDARDASQARGASRDRAGAQKPPSPDERSAPDRPVPDRFASRVGAVPDERAAPGTRAGSERRGRRS